MNPEISIIVPVYNDELYLKDCLNSILQQTFQEFEVIIVNNGSTDQSGMICDQYAGQDSRIKVIHQEYLGVSVARNTGIQNAIGKYIGFVDGDDYISENMYGELYNLCNETGSDIAVCKLGREVDGKLINPIEEEKMVEMDNEEAMRQLFKGELFRFSLCNKLFKATCFEYVLFPEGRIHEDLATTYKLFSKANKVIYKNFIGYIYVKRQNSILTSKYNESRLDSFIAWNEILKFMRVRYPHFYHDVLATFTYWCIDHFHYISQQVSHKKERNKYLGILQQNINPYYYEILKCHTISIKYKSISTLLNFKMILFYSFLKRLKAGN